MLLVLLTRILLWASIGLLLWYIVARIIPRQYLAWFGGVILILLFALTLVESDNETVRVLWQLLSFPLSPLGLSLLLIGGSLIEGFNPGGGSNKAKWTPIAIAFAILLFSSVPIFAQSLVTNAEQQLVAAFEEQSALCEDVCRVDQVPDANLAEAGAIAVIGNSRDVDVSIDGSRDSVVTNTVLAPRLIYAADIYNDARSRGANPLVVVTAGEPAGDNEQESIENQTIRSILQSRGVANNDIRIRNTGLEVYSAASDIEKLLQDQQIIAARDQRTDNERRVVVVAPAMLMPRAALTFESRNLEVIARPTDFYSARFGTEGGTLEKIPSLLPSVEALQLTTRYWDELLNSLYYFLRGWLPDFNFGWDSSIEI